MKDKVMVMEDVTYLLLGPRQLAFELSLLVKKYLVLPAESSKALRELLRKLNHRGGSGVHFGEGTLVSENHKAVTPSSWKSRWL